MRRRLPVGVFGVEERRFGARRGEPAQQGRVGGHPSSVAVDFGGLTGWLSDGALRLGSGGVVGRLLVPELAE
jgi:hypothetical protein